MRDLLYTMTAFMAVFILALSYVYLSSYYHAENRRIERQMQHSIDAEAHELSGMFENIRINVSHIHAFIQGGMKDKKFITNLDMISAFLKKTIAPHPEQFNAYVIWNKEKSLQYFNKAGYCVVVRKNPSLINTAEYGDIKTMQKMIFNEVSHYTDKNVEWWWGPQSHSGLHYTKIYYDADYMKIDMFSSSEAIYDDNGKFYGVVGIDVGTFAILNRMKHVEEMVNGYALLLDENSQIVNEFITSRTKSLNLDFNFENWKKSAGVQEVIAKDGTGYLVTQVEVKNRKLKLIVLKNKTEAYASFYSRLYFLLAFGVIILSALVALSSMVVRIINNEVSHLLSFLSQNSKSWNHADESMKDLNLYERKYAFYEFFKVSQYLNEYVVKLKEAVEKYEAEKVSALAAKKTQSIFLANMSHEIRTPLNAILGMAQTLSETELDQSQRKYVEVFASSANSLLNLIDHVLDISKIEAGQVTLEKGVVEIEKLIEDSRLLFARKASDQNLILICHVKPEMRHNVKGDALRLKQVVNNLLGNALKFTHAGSVRLTVRPSENASFYEIVIKDTGIGIKKDKIESIFENFVQAETSIGRRFGGTGLGLSISKSLVELMGGDIHVESEEGKGSTFTVVLPYERAADDSCIEEILIANSEDYKERYQRILVADDVITNQMVISLFLKSTRIAYDIVSNGQAAIEKFKKEKYDLVLMDIQMPILDGVTALKMIRDYEKQFRLVQTPVVALTAFAMSHEKEKFMREGFNDYLTKPLTKSELIKCLNRQAPCEKVISKKAA